MAKILIVDDEDSVRSVLKDVLDDNGHDIYEAGDGKEAYKIFNDNPIDLIITDLIMPEKNGIDLIMELKQQHPDLKILAISGGGGITGRFDYLPIAKLVGANIVINKPFNIGEIRAKVIELLTQATGNTAA